MDSLEKPVRIPPHYIEYANKHSIYAIQEDLLKRLIISRPSDPISFLIKVLKYEAVNKPSIFILGPPCVGKYTLGKYVARKLNCVHIPVKSLRSNAENIPDQENIDRATLYANYLRNRIADEECETRGYVLTGFPATAEEGKALQMLGIFPEQIIVLDAPHKVLRNRAAEKVIDGLTMEPYHRLYNPPSDPTIIERLEPTEDLKDLDARIAEYHHHHIILSQIYKNLIINIRADRSLSDVYQLAIGHLSRPRRNPAMWTPRVVLLGPSGSGRKTVAEKLAKRYDLVPVHCGTLIRKEIIQDTKLGNAMKSYTDARSAVPNEMVIRLLQIRLSEAACTLKGWVLFGFPRTKIQAQALDEADLAPNRVIFLNIGQADAAARLNARRTDTVTGNQYNLCQNPPPESTVLKAPGGRLGRQPGMSERQISLKLTRYMARRREMAEYYCDRALHVDADREEETVFERVEFLIVNEMPRTIYPK